MTLLPRRFTSAPSFRFVRLIHCFVLASAAILFGSPAVFAQSVSFAGASSSVNFGKVNLCAAGQMTPAPCSETLTLTYKVTGNGTLGPPKVLTLGAPDLDFTLAPGSTCTDAVMKGTTCTVNVKFAPLYPGGRAGGVQITGESGAVLATTLIYGYAVGGPRLGFNSVAPVTVATGIPYRPDQLALDGFGDLFIADFSGQIIEAPANGGSQILLGNLGGGVTDGVAIDGVGDLFMSDQINNQVIELPTGGGPQFPLSFSGLQGPLGIGVDGAGDVFVSDYFNNRVEELTAGGLQKTLGSGFVVPESLTADVAGNVFVQDFLNLNDGLARVQELPAGGGTQFTIASGPQFDSELGLGVDGLDDVFITNYGPSVIEVPAGGVPLTTVGSGLRLFQPSSVAVDGGGNLFIGDSQGYLGTGTVIELRRSQPPPLNFGELYLGHTTTLPLTLTNTGTGTLTVAPSIDNPAFQLLSATPANCLAGMTAGQTCALEIEFTPSTAGASSGVLSLETNGINSPNVSLTGSAVEVNAPLLSLRSGAYVGAQTVSITYSVAGAKIYYTTNGTAPTVSSTPYSNPISVTSTATIEAVAIVSGAPSAIAAAIYTIVSGTPVSVIQLENGFQAGGPMQLNGSTSLDDANLEFTNVGTLQAGSAFYKTAANIQSFTTDFTFQLPSSGGDGITFTIQNSGLTALGVGDEGLGYEGIGRSMAIKFDLYNNKGEGRNSTGLFIDGALPTIPAVNLTGTGIDLHSQHPILAQITYDGTNLVLTLTDTVTFANWSHSFAINIPATVGGDTAYIGFTGGTGSVRANQEILSWTYVSGPPGPPAPPPSIPAAPHYPEAFNAVGLATNGSASLSGNSLQLTDGGLFETGSAFYSAPLNVQSFSTDFTFQLSTPIASPPLSTIADGITFTIQNSGANALGKFGESLGYAPIGKSVAIKFDLHNNSGEGTNSTGLYIDGAMPTVPAIDLAGTGIDLHSGYPFIAEITYNGADLTLKLSDTVTHVTWTSDPLPINIPATVGGDTAYVGFTGGTGSNAAIQQILNWTFTNP